jgi:hypothetical protein
MTRGDDGAFEDDMKTLLAELRERTAELAVLIAAHGLPASAAFHLEQFRESFHGSQHAPAERITAYPRCID